MTQELILGTAGHIDHGKTSLIRALTGIDCDRLPDEKRRGITIDIGFAHLDLPGLRLGVVDCPGHERFIKNMLAGATGVDLALLVVAADDGIMPQSREHLEILQLLGITQGVVALTKCDRSTPAQRQDLHRAVAAWLQGTFLEHAPCVETSATTGEGLESLRSALQRAAERVRRAADHGPFRLAIDRAFSVPGHGTVVTGSALSGRLQVGDPLEWLPAGQVVRVRGLHHHDTAVSEVRRGQRAAINLHGVSLEEVRRGQELATPGTLQPSRVLTVQLAPLRDAPRPLTHRLPVRVHLGTGETPARLSLLDCNELRPGQRGLAQLFLDAPACAVWGQPLIVRDASAETTLGGGVVLRPVDRRTRRRHLDWVERVEQLASADVATRVGAVCWLAGSAGVDAGMLPREAGVEPGDCDARLGQLLQRGEAIALPVGGGTRVLHRERVAELEGRLLAALGELHRTQPLLTHHDPQALLQSLQPAAPEGVLRAVLQRLVDAGAVRSEQRRVARSDFKPRLSSNQRKLKDRIVAAHLGGGFTPPEPQEFAGAAKGNLAHLEELFAVAVAEGSLVRLTDQLHLHREIEQQLRQRVETALRSHANGMSVADIRDLLGTTRKYAVPICEYLDRAGVTRRVGDLRVRPDAER